MTWRPSTLLIPLEEYSVPERQSTVIPTYLSRSDGREVGRAADTASNISNGVGWLSLAGVAGSWLFCVASLAAVLSPVFSWLFGVCGKSDRAVRVWLFRVAGWLSPFVALLWLLVIHETPANQSKTPPPSASALYGQGQSGAEKYPPTSTPPAKMERTWEEWLRNELCMLFPLLAVLHVAMFLHARRRETEDNR
jgi:hypothetical protein